MFDLNSTDKQRNATQRNATQRNATQRNATQRNATQRNATQRNAVYTANTSGIKYRSGPCHSCSGWMSTTSNSCMRCPLPATAKCGQSFLSPFSPLRNWTGPFAGLLKSNKNLRVHYRLHIYPRVGSFTSPGIDTR